jgi:fumarate hydratase subunit beta
MELTFPLTSNATGLTDLNAGDEVFLSGNLIVTRDESVRRLAELISAGENFSLNLSGAAVFFAGPLPRSGDTAPIIIGPTTSRRMDKFTPTIFSAGVKATIGKGPVNEEVIAACRKYQSVYLLVTGGVGAYLSRFMKDIKIVLWPELGPEAVYNLTVEKLPATVAIDTGGNNLFPCSR